MSDALTGALLGFGGSIFSGLMGQSSADQMMAFQREAMQNRYQWTMQDLKKAGLNPMLAVGNMSSGSAAGAMSKWDNPGSAAVQSASAYKQLDLAERQQRNQDSIALAEVRAKDAQTAYVNAQTLTEGQKFDSGYFTNSSALLGASADEKREQIQNLVVQRSQLAQQISESQARTSQLEQQVVNARKEYEVLNATVSKVRNEAAESASRTRLNQASTTLSQAEQALMVERQRTQKALTLATGYDAEAKRLGLAKSGEENYWFTSPIGKVFHRTGEMIRSINPFSFK